MIKTSKIKHSATKQCSILVKPAELKFLDSPTEGFTVF